MFDEMEVLAVNFRFPPSEIKALSIRERQNWIARALKRATRLKRAFDV